MFIGCYWKSNLRKMSDKESLVKKQGESSNSCVHFHREEDLGICELTGDWSLLEGGARQAYAKWHEFLSSNPTVEVMKFTVVGIGYWDSSLIIFLNWCGRELSDLKKEFDCSELPDGMVCLIRLSQGTKTHKSKRNFNLDAGLTLLGGGISRIKDGVLGFVSFWGEWVQALFLMFTGRSNMRFRDWLNACRACGASALPIVTLISFLTGLTMAFVGSVQLEKFNAKIYVADLVSLAMVREMGALMVAIVMAGRTGAAFAAELGSMKLNEEIDSLKTFGISPMQFLVLPRTIALLLMTPLLTLYADVVGILGGVAVGTQVMDFSVVHYFDQTQTALRGMWEVYSGLVKSLAFGLIIGLVGCFKGLRSGNDSASLGRAVTSAVVTSITLIVICDALFEIVFSYLDLR
jgi:phospholipid/cholesterol/gamma-HCH transport system permease protein